MYREVSHCLAGIHMFTLFDASAPSWNLLVFVLIEVLVVTWVYGLDRFLDNMEEMDIKLGKITRCNPIISCLM